MKKILLMLLAFGVIVLVGCTTGTQVSRERIWEELAAGTGDEKLIGENSIDKETADVEIKEEKV